MQEHLFGHFSSPGRNGFLNDVSITFIDKTDPSDPLKREDYRRRTISVFWWVSSGLICSPVDLMHDVMKSSPSFLIYCCYCLCLFILWLSIVSIDKLVYWFRMQIDVLLSTYR